MNRRGHAIPPRTLLVRPNIYAVDAAEEEAGYKIVEPGRMAAIRVRWGLARVLEVLRLDWLRRKFLFNSCYLQIRPQAATDGPPVVASADGGGVFDIK